MISRNEIKKYFTDRGIETSVESIEVDMVNHFVSQSHPNDSTAKENRLQELKIIHDLTLMSLHDTVIVQFINEKVKEFMSRAEV